MRRLVCLLAGVLLVVPSLGSDAPKEYDGATEKDELEGTWELTLHEIGGVGFTPTLTCEVTFRRGTYIARYGDGDTIRATYRFDRSHQPPHLDLCPSSEDFNGQTLKGVCEIKGDTLRFTPRSSPNDFRRPQDLNDAKVRVSVYKRVK
jgi:uncharacterized protein (TIGR03067 family)